MKKHSYIYGAIILTLGSVLAKGLGALYKIPLTNILGSYGIGMYYLIFPIFSFVITFSSSGIATGLNILVAKENGGTYRNKFKLLIVAMLLTMLVSAGLMMIIILFSKWISLFQGYVSNSLSFVAIAPAILISSEIAVLRGFFQGVDNMMPTTISLLIEQVIKMVVGLTLSRALMVYGIDYAVLGAVIGVTISEIVALVIITIHFIIYKNKYKRLYTKQKVVNKIIKNKTRVKISSLKPKIYTYISYTYKDTFFKILKLGVPLTLSKIISPIMLLIDSFIIINVLVMVGFSVSGATTLYGISTGMVATIGSITTIVVSSLITALIPKINDDKNSNIIFIFKIIIIISLTMSVFIIIGSDAIINILFGGPSSNVYELSVASKLLKLSSVSIIYGAITQLCSVILQSKNKAMVPFITLGVGVIFRIGVLVGAVVMGFNIYAVEIANAIYYSMSSIILLLSVKKYVNISLSGHSIISVGSLYFMALIIGYVINNVLNMFIGNIIATIITSLVIGIFVIISLKFSDIFTKEEKNMLSIKRKFNKNLV